MKYKLVVLLCFLVCAVTEIKSNLECVFGPGNSDGVSVWDKPIITKEQCAQYCLDKATGDPSINGVFYEDQRQICHCRQNITVISPDSARQPNFACFFTKIRPNCVFERGLPDQSVTTLSMPSIPKEVCALLCTDAATNDPLINGAIYEDQSQTCQCRQNMKIISNEPSYFVCLFTTPDPCSSNNGNCPAKSKCSNDKGTARCECDPGYEMNNLDDGSQVCQEFIEFCNNTECPDNSYCVDIASGPACSCNEGYFPYNDTCERIETGFKASLRLNKAFKTVYSDSTSPEFMTLAKEIEPVILEVVKPAVPGIESVKVIELSSGSTKATFISLVTPGFSGNIAASSVTTALEQGLSTGKFNSIDAIQGQSISVENLATPDPCSTNNGNCPANSNCSNDNGNARCHHCYVMSNRDDGSQVCQELKWTRTMLAKDKTMIEKGKLLTKLDKLTKEFIISIEVELGSTCIQSFRWSSSCNIFRFMYDDDRYIDLLNSIVGAYGLAINPKMDGIPSSAYFFTIADARLGDWIHIKMSQTQESSGYRFSVSVDDSEINSAINSQPHEFNNVEVYTSASGYDSQIGSIRNFYVETFDPCSQNNGNCPANSNCSNDKGTLRCECHPGYVMNNLDDGSQVCQQAPDPCSSNNGNCPAKSKCSNDNGTARCECDPGYVMNNRGDGSQVCQDVNECDEDPCHEFATCRNTRGSYQCTCQKGYMGDGSRCQEMWLSNSRCGAAHRLPNGMKAQCNHKGNTPCCSDHGFCGLSPKHCECPMCVDYRQGCLYNDMEITGETLRDHRDISDWRECERLCQKATECRAWAWTSRTFTHKMCTLKRDGDVKKLSMQLGVMSGLKHCPDVVKRGDIGSAARNVSRPKITTCSYRASCVGNMCTRGAVLKIGDSLRSDNKKYTATMQNDGNFVIYCNDGGITKPIWSSRTDGQRVNEGLVFQRDGNLVIDTGEYAKEAIWSSGTYNTEADHLIMQDNGNMVIYGFHGNKLYWESKSYGMC